MNTRQLQYAVLLAEELSFSAAAEKLGISQPALSKQILNLETELGIKLFERTTASIALTPAGAHFIREVKGILYKEHELLRSMEKFKSGEAGELVIGITPFRSSYLAADVINNVRLKFPHTTVKLHEVGSDVLRKEAAEGKYDFAIVNLPVDDAVFDITPLEADKLALVIPKAMEGLVSETGAVIRDFKSCKDLPFVVVGQTQEMRCLFDKLCTSANFSPIIAAEVVGLTTAKALAFAGVGAAVLPLQFVSADNRGGVVVKEIKSVSYSRVPVIVTKKGQYISPVADYAIKLFAHKG